MNYLHFNKKKYSVEDLKKYSTKEVKNYVLRGKPTAIISDDILMLISLIINFKNGDNKLIFIYSSIYTENIKAIILENGYNIVEVLNNSVSYLSQKNKLNQQSEISIFTSGTTGTPKLIKHSWKSLNTFENVKNRSKNNWLVSYSPTSYAWYQMIIMFLEVENQNLVIPSLHTIDILFEEAFDSNITAISSTPSFWRYQLLNNSMFLSKLKLKQITLGGEFVDQNILDTLSKFYPKCNITHIYASTEAGASIVVQDKLEGFPVEWLKTKNQRFKVKNKTLYLKGKNSSIENMNKWYNTNDSVKIENNRVVIIGRKNSRVANIGGNKIDLDFVESIIKKNKNLLYCRVYSKRSPIVNNIIVADIVVKKGIKFEEIKKELFSFCKNNKLEDWMIPRRWYEVNTISLSDNFKMV